MKLFTNNDTNKLYIQSPQMYSNNDISVTITTSITNIPSISNIPSITNIPSISSILNSTNMLFYDNTLKFVTTHINRISKIKTTSITTTKNLQVPISSTSCKKSAIASTSIIIPVKTTTIIATFIPNTNTITQISTLK